VAVSFVREPADIRKVKGYIRRAGKSVPVIAKIEKPEAVEGINAIVQASDGIMVARGDLGVEMRTEEVPLIQKMLIDRANRAGKLVITATQMLESMTEHTRPTRAEATDVANAVLDGTDALMLSAETSKGKYPLKSLQMMDRIIRETELHREASSAYMALGSYSEAVAEAAVEAARDVGARYVVAFTHSGLTARLLSKERPGVPILAFTPSEGVMRRMALYWGVAPMRLGLLASTDKVFEAVERTLLKEGLARRGDTVVITASAPIGGEGKTNIMKLHRLGG
jgi:pyruvate kinase